MKRAHSPQAAAAAKRARREREQPPNTQNSLNRSLVRALVSGINLTAKLAIKLHAGTRFDAIRAMAAVGTLNDFADSVREDLHRLGGPQINLGTRAQPKGKTMLVALMDVIYDAGHNSECARSWSWAHRDKKPGVTSKTHDDEIASALAVIVPYVLNQLDKYNFATKGVYTTAANQKPITVLSYVSARYDWNAIYLPRAYKALCTLLERILRLSPRSHVNTRFQFDSRDCTWPLRSVFKQRAMLWDDYSWRFVRTMPNSHPKEGMTTSFNIDIAMLLLAYGANINQVSVGSGKTVLHDLVESGDDMQTMQLFELLQAHGALRKFDWNRGDVHGKTVVDLARTHSVPLNRYGKEEPVAKLETMQNKWFKDRIAPVILDNTPLYNDVLGIVAGYM